MCVCVCGVCVCVCVVFLSHTRYMPVLEHKRSMHARMRARERVEEREGGENMRAFSKRERPGVKEVTTNTTAPCSKSPKPTDTRTDLIMHIPLSLHPCTCTCSRFPSLRFLKHRRTRSWCTGKPSTFSGVCRSSVTVLRREKGFAEPE